MVGDDGGGFPSCVIGPHERRLRLWPRDFHRLGPGLVVEGSLSAMFDPASLAQAWPKPAKPRPIVTFGAGSIVGDAHFPAYRKAGFPVAGLYDPDQEKATKLADAWGVTAFRTIEEAASVPEAIFDLATPPARHLDVLNALPHGSVALIQKPMGSDLSGATEILEICRQKNLACGGEFSASLRAYDARPQRRDSEGLARTAHRFRCLACARDPLGALGLPQGLATH